jgi:hypothetical protein
MAALRRVLAQERPIVLKAIEMFGAEMCRKGVIEAARIARENDSEALTAVAMDELGRH